MNNFATCLLCNNADETNIHIWNCPVLFTTIKECFKILADNLLKTEGGKLTITVDDTIKYSPTLPMFHWALSD